MADLNAETFVVWHEHNNTGVPEHVFGVQRMDPETAMDDAVDYIETCIAEDMSKAREDKSGITVSYATGANGELYATTETDNQTTYYSIVVNARGFKLESGPGAAGETCRKPDAGHDVTGEETCYKCDTQIKYRIEAGATVVTCPECGAVNPICNECTMPEREDNACHTCELARDCEKLNKLMAKGVRK